MEKLKKLPETIYLSVTAERLLTGTIPGGATRVQRQTDPEPTQPRNQIRSLMRVDCASGVTREPWRKWPTSCIGALRDTPKILCFQHGLKFYKKCHFLLREEEQYVPACHRLRGTWEIVHESHTWSYPSISLHSIL